MKKTSSAAYFTERDYGGVNHVDTPVVYFNNFISEEKCDEIVKYCESSKKLQSGNTFGEADNARRSDIAWLNSSEMPDLFDKVMNSAVNSNYWDYDIYGFADPAQYTVYDARKYEKPHYTWHMDIGPNHNHRKMSMVINLTLPEAFDGGDLKVEYCNNEDLLPNKGSAVLFPSFLHHQVSPVTKGIRRSLVFWIAGPKLR